MDEFESYFTMFRLRKIWRSRMNRHYGRTKARGSGWKAKMMFGSYWWIEGTYVRTMREFDGLMRHRKTWGYFRRVERDVEKGRRD